MKVKIGTTLYVVVHSLTEGERILGIFETEELAQKCIEDATKIVWYHPSDVRIDEYGLNGYYL